MGTKKTTNPQVEDIKKLLDIFINTFSIVGPENTTESKRQVAFELLSCVCAFHVSPFYAKDNCWTAKKIGDEYKTDGQDGKIDGYYVQANDEQITVNVLQSKFTDRVRQNDVELFFASVKKYIITQTNQLPDGYKSLKTIIDTINKKREQHPNAVSKFKLYLCSGADNNRIKAFQDCFEHENFGSDVEIEFLNYTNINNIINNIQFDILNEYTNKNTIRLKSETKIQNLPTVDVAVAILSGKEVVKLIKSEFEVNFELSRLFSGNVRGFLDKTEVNLAIRDTLKNEPSTFITKNNGVVITCDNYTIDPNETDITITNPVIINGQQTVSTIYNFYSKGTDSSNICVLIKFIKVSDESNRDKKLIEIAKASNQSNKIGSIDLLSNRPLFKDLFKQFGQKNIYLKIKDGELLNELFLQRLTVVDFKDLLQIWVAIFLKRPADAKTVNKNIEIFTKAYEGTNDVFKSLTLQKNADKLIRSFIYSYDVLLFKNTKVYEFFKNETYYKHAQFFILYLLNEKHPNHLESSTDKDLAEVKEKLEMYINNARTKKESDGLEFTYNNYFKSTNPQSDYLSNSKNKNKLLTVADAIEEFINS